MRLATEWEPATDTQPDDQGIIANHCTEVGEDGKNKTVPLAMADIMATAKQLTGDWPRRIDNVLFVHEGDDVAFLEKTPALFGYYHHVTGVRWGTGPTMVTKPEFFAEATRQALSYTNVECLPHVPMFRDHYYTCGDIQPGDGSHLAELVDRFAPETLIDRDLILAAFATPGWGGPPGSRPAWCITSDFGRGSGKTTLAEMVGLVWNGVLSFSHRENINDIKQRLLSPAAMTKRVALLDNVKSLKFSWAELEAMVTAVVINGKRMYHGDGVRPNTLNWFITLNGASLSTDMAQRSIIIKLDRPQRSGSWSDDTRAYIEQHREHIVADVVGFLQSKPATLERFSRWANWERDILARLPEPADAQKVIEERQVGVDVEAEEAEHLEDYFAEKLRWLGYGEDEWVFIPSGIANRWYCTAQNDRLTTSQTTRLLNQLVTEGRLKRLRGHRLNRSRGFLWPGTTIGSMICTDLDERLRSRENQ